MTSCPKCGGVKIIGPRYVYDSMRGERLSYSCYTCGYVRTEPTRDSESTPSPYDLSEGRKGFRGGPR